MVTVTLMGRMGLEPFLPATIHTLKGRISVTARVNKTYGLFTLPEPRPRPRQRPRPMNWVQNPMASATVSVSAQCVHLHTILYNPFFIGLGLGLGLGQWEWAIKVRTHLHKYHSTGAARVCLCGVDWEGDCQTWPAADNPPCRASQIHHRYHRTNVVPAYDYFCYKKQHDDIRKISFVHFFMFDVT